MANQIHEAAQCVARLVGQAQRDDYSERRQTPRFPYFRPVNVAVVENGRPRQRFSAFSRDISLHGIGLVHTMPLKPGPVTVEVIEADGNLALLAGNLEWTRPAGEGWHLSGVRFQE